MIIYVKYRVAEADDSRVVLTGYGYYITSKSWKNASDEITLALLLNNKLRVLEVYPITEEEYKYNYGLNRIGVKPNNFIKITPPIAKIPSGISKLGYIGILLLISAAAALIYRFVY